MQTIHRFVFLVGGLIFSSIVFAQEQEKIIKTLEQKQTTNSNTGNKSINEAEGIKAIHQTNNNRILPPGINVSQMVGEEYRKSGKLDMKRAKIENKPDAKKEEKPGEKEPALKKKNKEGNVNEGAKQNSRLNVKSNSAGNKNTKPSNPVSKSGYTKPPPPGNISYGETKLYPSGVQGNAKQTPVQNQYGNLSIKPKNEPDNNLTAGKPAAKQNTYDKVSEADAQKMKDPKPGYTPGPLRKSSNNSGGYESVNSPLGATNANQSNTYTRPPAQKGQLASGKIPVNTYGNVPSSNTQNNATGYSKAPPPVNSQSSSGTVPGYGQLPQRRTDNVSGNKQGYGQLPARRTDNSKTANNIQPPAKQPVYDKVPPNQYDKVPPNQAYGALPKLNENVSKRTHQYGPAPKLPPGQSGNAPNVKRTHQYGNAPNSNNSGNAALKPVTAPTGANSKSLKRTTAGTKISPPANAKAAKVKTNSPGKNITPAAKLKAKPVRKK